MCLLREKQFVPFLILVVSKSDIYTIGGMFIFNETVRDPWARQKKNNRKRVVLHSGVMNKIEHLLQIVDK